jgi:hypothetical protein
MLLSSNEQSDGARHATSNACCGVVQLYSLDSSNVDRAYKLCMAHLHGEVTAVAPGGKDSGASAAGAAVGGGGGTGADPKAAADVKEGPKLAACCVLGALALRFGQQFIMSMTDVVATLCKLVCGTHVPFAGHSWQWGSSA